MDVALKTAFHWDPDSRVWLGPIFGVTEEPPSPEEPDTYYVPGGEATFDPVPALAAKQAARRLANNTGWEVVPDHRGTTYWLPDRTKHKITEVDQLVPEGASLTEPEPLPPTDAELRAAAGAFVQKRLNALARSWEYTDYIAARTYVGDPYAKFDAEARAMVAYGSACYALLDSLQAAVVGGESERPDSIPALQALLLDLLPPLPERPAPEASEP